MNKEKYIQKIITILSLILLFISTPARSISEFNHLNDNLFYIGGLLILIIAISSLVVKDILMNNSFKINTLFYGVFILAIIISTFVNGNLESEMYSLERFILIYFFLAICLTLTNVINENLIIRSFIISSGIIFIYFLIEYPISETLAESYKGGFYNPNSVGVLAVTLFSVSIAAGTSLLKNKQRYILAFIYLLIALGAGYLTLISNSRTSFMTIVIVLIIISVTFVYDVLKTRNLLSWKNVFIIAILALGGMSLFFLTNNPVYALLESTVLEKFTRKIEAGSLTAGRAAIWKPIIEGAGLFGKGDGYFSKISGLGAHNSFLHVLSIYGWFAAVAYVVFWLAMLIKSIHYYLTKKLTHTYAILPLILIVNYISISMMENMTFHVSAFLAISMVAVFNKSEVQSLKA